MITKEWDEEYENENQPLNQMVYDTIYYAIASGKFKPGEHLAENFLAQYLKVSRTPVRAAIIRLEREGLVIRMNGRAVVEYISNREIEDVLEMRVVLEKLAVANAVKKITEDGINYLKNANEEFRSALYYGKKPHIVRADEKFHDLIYQLAKNNTLLKITREFEKTLYRYRIKSFDTYRRKEVLLWEHEEIIAGLERQDEKAAVEAVTAHINRQRNVMLGSSDENSDSI